MQSIDSHYHTKNRIVAVDIVRLLAATLVMYEHLCYQIGGEWTAVIVREIPRSFCIVSPMFFVLAGYFACRNLTWKKALNNSWWSLAPFLLWNTLCILALNPDLFKQSVDKLFGLYGMQNFFFNSWAIFPNPIPRSMPINEPLWFMRDLIFLFLLSPFLMRGAKIIFPLCIIGWMIPQLTPYFTKSCACSLASVTYFTGGCFLRALSKDFQKKALTFYSPIICIAFLTFTIADSLYLHWLLGNIQWHLIKNFLGMWVLYQIARMIEVKLPWLTPYALKLAPVTFLTFAAHAIVYCYFRRYIPQDIVLSDAALLLPIATFVILAPFFFALKRWCPWSVHLIAHYKLRPDDLKQVKENATAETPQEPQRARAE